jgi:hypothetical protein
MAIKYDESDYIKQILSSEVNSMCTTFLKITLLWSSGGWFSLYRNVKYKMAPHIVNAVQHNCSALLEISMSIIRRNMKNFPMCLTNYALRHEGVWGSGCIKQPFPDIGISWRRVVRFATRPPYPRGKSPRYSLDRRLGEPQNRSGRREEEKILDATGTQIPTPRSSSQ